MQDTWINHGVYPIFEAIGNFQNYFSSVGVYIAAICLLMTLLMTVVKVYLGVTNAREQIIKMGTTFCLYLFFMYCYPIAMRAILPFSMNLGYGAIFATNGISMDDKFKDVEEKGASKNEFYTWVGEHSNGIFTSSESTDESGNVQVALDMNFVDASTGYMDLNKFFQYVLAFFTIGFHCIPKISIINLDLVLLLSVFIFFLGILIVATCMIISMMNYLTCLIDYFALMGFGVLTIPLSLWDGTKSYTEKLFSSIGSIIIKLIVISAFMNLATFMILDFFCEVFIFSKEVGFAVGIKDSLKLMQLALVLILKSFILIMLTMNVGKIAGFINGGSPSMSLGEAAIGAGATAALAGTAGKGAKAVTAARGNLAGGIGKMIMAGKQGHALSKAAGESGKQSFANGMKSALATGGSSLAKSIGGGAKKLAGGLLGAGNSILKASGLGHGISAEGFGGLQFGGKGGGGSSGGGSSGGGSNGGGGSSGGGGGTGTDAPVNNQMEGNNKTYESSYIDKDGQKQVVQNEKKGLENEGADSVYGNASVTRDEKGNVNGYETQADKMIGQAGAMASNGGYFERKKAAVIGTAGAIMKNVREARKEREKGNVIGNSTGKAILRGLKQGGMGAIAGAVNSNGGMKLRFNAGGSASHVYGSSHVNVRMNASDNRQQNSNGEFVRNPMNLKAD